MKNKKIILAGGTGFIGQSLIKYFGKENEIIILGRETGDSHKNLYSHKLLTAKEGYKTRSIKWGAGTDIAEWGREIDGAHLVINLAGKSVNCRYHSRQKKELIDSRVTTTKAIGDAIRMAKVKPELWINAASATIYKHSTDSPNDECTGIISDWKKDNMPCNPVDRARKWKNKFIARILHGKNSREYREPDLDFSVRICKTWEKTFFDQSTPGTRKVALRMAITLGEDGVLTPYLTLCKFGLGGPHGNGRQLFSWVHIEDVAGMMKWLYEKKDAEGVYNCAAPHAVTNYEFMKILRKVTGHYVGLPAYTWMLEAGAFLIGTETELMLKSRWVIPARAVKEGFDFNYKYPEDALINIIGNMPRKKYHLF